MLYILASRTLAFRFSERNRRGKGRSSSSGGKNSAEMMGVVKLAIADGVITFMWMFCASALGVGTSVISSSLNLGHYREWAPLPELAVTTALIFLIVFFFTLLGGAMGGASFNPTATASFYAAGFGGAHDNTFTVALRLPAQVSLFRPLDLWLCREIEAGCEIYHGNLWAVGAVVGAMAILEVISPQYKHMVAGPSLKVDMHTGAIAEGVLTFVMSFIALLVIQKGPESLVVKSWMLSISTVAVIIAGSSFTGPSMNPVNLVPECEVHEFSLAFGWAYLSNSHQSWEQFYVYWICPFVGAILAAWVYRFIFPPVKQKKA
ncbi:hypothetical protein ACLOJK_035867 [Asimina triloba]